MGDLLRGAVRSTVSVFQMHVQEDTNVYSSTCIQCVKCTLQWRIRFLWVRTKCCMAVERFYSVECSLFFVCVWGGRLFLNRPSMSVAIVFLLCAA